MEHLSMMDPTPKLKLMGIKLIWFEYVKSPLKVNAYSHRQKSHKLQLGGEHAYKSHLELDLHRQINDKALCNWALLVIHLKATNYNNPHEMKGGPL